MVEGITDELEAVWIRSALRAGTLRRPAACEWCGGAPDRRLRPFKTGVPDAASEPLRDLVWLCGGCLRGARRALTPGRPPLGRQPGGDLIRRRHGTIAAVARRCGLDVLHLYGVLRGALYPSHDVAARLTGFLGVPVTDLFTTDALAHLHEVRPGRPATPLADDLDPGSRL